MKIENSNPTQFVAHLHFLPTHKPSLKNAKELPSQRITDSTNLKRQTFDRKKAQQVTWVAVAQPHSKSKISK